MSSLNAEFYPIRILGDDRQKPLVQNGTMRKQPFLKFSEQNPGERFIVALTREMGRWSDIYSPEQTAYALGQLTAAAILPHLDEVWEAGDLLEYRVCLRERVDSWVIDELADVLDTCGADLNWDQVDSASYVSPIGAGMAACIDMSKGKETLRLRYAAFLSNILHNTRYPMELPRSLYFLQANLDERFDVLLEQVRQRAAGWLTGA